MLEGKRRGIISEAVYDTLLDQMGELCWRQRLRCASDETHVDSSAAAKDGELTWQRMACVKSNSLSPLYYLRPKEPKGTFYMEALKLRDTLLRMAPLSLELPVNMRRKECINGTINATPSLYCKPS
jgi:hypothetical protein